MAAGVLLYRAIGTLADPKRGINFDHSKYRGGKLPNPYLTGGIPTILRGKTKGTCFGFLKNFGTFQRIYFAPFVLYQGTGRENLIQRHYNYSTP